MKKNDKIIIILMILGMVMTIGVTFSLQIFTKNISYNDFIVTYDTTWKVIEKENRLKLEHKKSKAVLSIQCKDLEKNYLDVNLSDIINDIMYEIEEQNKDYKLINMFDSPSDKYQSYSYLYEDESNQVLVNVYKKDTKVIIAYYEATNEYYDIVLDSVDTILDSLIIISGEKVN